MHTPVGAADAVVVHQGRRRRSADWAVHAWTCRDDRWHALLANMPWPSCLVSPAEWSGWAAVDDYKKSGEGKTHSMKQLYRYRPWPFWCIRDGLLMNEGEKFHYAISHLDRLITVFFAPRGLLLNGVIVGVNTESAGCVYVYHVKDNVITLDEDVTREFCELYWDLEHPDLDDSDQEIVEDATQIVLEQLCERMGVDLESVVV